MDAFEQGYQAYIENKSIAANPYESSVTPLDFNEWESGWIAAEEVMT